MEYSIDPLRFLKAAIQSPTGEILQVAAICQSALRVHTALHIIQSIPSVRCQE